MNISVLPRLAAKDAMPLIRRIIRRSLPMGLSLGLASPGLLACGVTTARLISPEYAVAGKPTPMQIEITVGARGIPVGGGIAIGFHLGSNWKPAPQANNPSAPAYITFGSKTPGNFNINYGLTRPNMLVDQRSGTPNDGIFRRAIIAKVVNRALDPCETVTVGIGDEAHGASEQDFADTTHELRVMTDEDGDGLYQGIGRSPSFDVIPAPADHLAAVIPSQVVVGHRFRVQIHAEDKYDNFVHNFYHVPVPSYNGLVTITNEKGVTLASNVPIKDGWGITTVSLSKPGPHWLFVSDGTLKGQSNPTKAFRRAPEYHIYWGDIHGHSIASDGLADHARQYYWYARKAEHLDVCALTDHFQLGWFDNISAIREYYKPNQYVTLLGFENGSTDRAHFNIYFPGDTADFFRGRSPSYKDSLAALYKQYGSDIIVGPHHFSYPVADPQYPFGDWDGTIERFVEVYSDHGASEYLGNPRPLLGASDPAKFMQAGLASGLRFGVIGSGDNHNTQPGHSLTAYRYAGGLVAFRAKQLTREAIFKAFHDYQVYATSLERIYLDFSINGAWMGSEVVSGDPVHIHYEAIGQTQNLKVDLIRNNELIRTDSTGNGAVNVTFDDLPPADKNFYYLRVTQDNGERAWSTPVWVSH